MSELREQVRERYAAAAKSVGRGQAADDMTEEACCDPSEGYALRFYDRTDRDQLPDDAILASLGCGNPIMVADLREGETVLDLGSGGGIDVLLSAKRVGPTGKAYGLDMTDEMLSLARQNAMEAGADNVEFLKGYIEEIPLPDESVDVVISNCVINLSTNKPRVMSEISRVLRAGGRFGVSDVVAGDGLSEADRLERGAWVGCIAGAPTLSEYSDLLMSAGLVDISIDITHELAEQMYGANIRAKKP